MKLLILASCLLAASLPALAETPVQNRIDFQTEVEAVAPNDLLTANLSLESSNKNPTVLARELTQKINDALKLGLAFKTVKLTSGNQQTWPIYSDKNKLESWRGRAEIRLESQDFKAAGELIRRYKPSACAPTASGWRGTPNPTSWCK